MNQKQTNYKHTEYREWEAMGEGSGLALRQLHGRVLQGHLQPTLQKSSLTICFLALESWSIRNKVDLTPVHCHTVSIGVTREMTTHQAHHSILTWLTTACRHFTTGSAHTVLSGPSPLLVLVSSESKSANINRKIYVNFKIVNMRKAIWITQNHLCDTLPLLTKYS